MLSTGRLHILTILMILGRAVRQWQLESAADQGEAIIRASLPPRQQTVRYETFKLNFLLGNDT